MSQSLCANLSDEEKLLLQLLFGPILQGIMSDGLMIKHARYPLDIVALQPRIAS